MRKDELIYALKNLSHRRLRSFLSIISILIGITAIFALISFGLGIQNYVTELGEEAGTDKLYIQSKGIGIPGTDKNFFFTADDIDFVDKINGVGKIVGMYVGTPETEFKNEKRYGFLAAWDPKEQEFIDELFGGIGINKGRGFKKGELNKAVLGYLYQFENKIFKKAIKLGDRITLDGTQFEVIGFYEEIGNAQDDSNIYISDDAFEVLYPEKKDKFGYAMLQADIGVAPSALADKIEDKLRKRKGQDEGKEDFFVQTYEDALEIFGNIFAVINGVLVLIALISLIVAAVNIMNTMYTSVLERTNEIGLMKSVGAKNKDILTIFIIESGFLGTVGGVIGIIFGYLIAKAGEFAAASAGYSFLKPVFPWYLTAGCIFFAFFVGAISGFLPALQASRLKPVDALRYE